MSFVIFSFLPSSRKSESSLDGRATRLIFSALCYGFYGLPGEGFDGGMYSLLCGKKSLQFEEKGRDEE